MNSGEKEKAPMTGASVEMSDSESESEKYYLETSTSVANLFYSRCQVQLAGITAYRFTKCGK